MMRVDAIDPTTTAMIVVDMQNDFVAVGAPMETPAARAMVPKLVEAPKMCRDAGIRVIYTAHVHRRDGCDMRLFNMHPPVAKMVALVDGTPGEISTLSEEQPIACRVVTTIFRRRPRDDDRVTITGWRSCRMRRRHTTTQIEALDRCLER